MEYFVVQIKVNREDAFLSRAQRSLLSRSERQRLFFPKRRLTLRRGGKPVQEVKPLFPGYVFIEAETIDTELYKTIKQTPDFFRFLKSNQNITPLSDRDLAIIKHFVSFGEVANASQVYFNESDRIVVAAGPLKGFEGSIVKVDRRKKRAKIQIDFSDNSFFLDLAFEVIEKDKDEKKKGAPND
jgi:transcriptional antiterminator NusG